MDTPPTMSQFASREACLLARDKWFQEQLEAAKQRELELLAVIERMTDLRDELAGIAADVDSGNGFDIVCRKTLSRVMDGLSYIEPLDALNEYRAKELVDVSNTLYNLRLRYPTSCDEGINIAVEQLRRMAEERRKK